MDDTRDKKRSEAAQLRQRAEVQIDMKTAEIPQTHATDDTLRLIHELEVHQIELEMQNSALSLSRDEVESALEKYTDLYDFAPISYFTLDSSGVILSVNLTGSHLLGVDRSVLLGKRFGLLVGEQYRPAFSAFLESLFTSQGKRSCEIEIMNLAQIPIAVHVEAAVPESGQWCHLAVIDTSEKSRLQAQTIHLASFPRLNPNPILELDFSLRVLYVNQAVENILESVGLDGKDCRVFIPPDIQVIIDNKEDAHDGTVYRELEIRGRYFGANILLVHQFEVVRIYAYEITERKRAELALQNSESLYRAIGETINYGIWVCKPDGRNIYASKSFLNLVGITQQQCSDFGWGDVLHPDDAERTIAAWKECVRTEGTWEIEHRYRGVDGQWHPILARGVPVRDDAGTILYWAGINLDISRIKEAERERHKSEELNRMTLQSLPGCIAVVDHSGCIISVNKTWSDFAIANEAAETSKVAVGVNYCDVCRRAAANKDPDAAEALAGIEAVLNGTLKQYSMEYACHTPTKKQWFLMTVVPLGPHGNDGAVITHFNITERRLYEEHLQHAHQQMEEKVVKRTSELKSMNVKLLQEIDERRKAETSLQVAYEEIKQLKDRLEAENIYLQHEVAQEHNFGEIVGQCKALSSLFMRVKQVAPMNATVLLLGETGSGKGVVARAIHSNSSRKDRPMITVNCTALPANLIESELFGRERGAFTGAHERQVGRFELANGGTIFLDEIGEMPIDLQCKLLRVIQDGEFERLGSSRSIKVDVRIIAATNRNLEAEISKGTFREDLYYRLNVFPITIPPLRERMDDIPLLVDFFIKKFNKKNNKKIESVSRETMKQLTEYHWPGNVRELESVIERAVITSQGTKLHIMDRFTTLEKNDLIGGKSLKPLAELEQEHILHVLGETNWRIEGAKGAALRLGLNPSTLRARMRKYGMIR